MNAPVPSGVDDRSDIVPLYGSSYGWTLIEHYFEAGFSWFKVQRQLDRDQIGILKLLVLDYAAEGFLTARNPNSPLTPVYSPRKIPNNHDFVWRFHSTADPDSDGFTVWEEYRGFCTYDADRHFRLDLDEANAERQVIVIDSEGFLNRHLVNGFQTRLEQIMDCRLVVKNNIFTSPVDGHCPNVTWDKYERIDTYQGFWDGSWVPNNLTNPLYVRPAPADSSGLTRASDQVAFRLSQIEIEGAFGACCHKASGSEDWGYGICGTSGISYDLAFVRSRVLEWWPPLDGYGGFINHPQRRDSVLAICYRRLIAHELGHGINTKDHLPDQHSGNNLMCVMLNNMLRVENPTRPQCIGNLPSNAEDLWEDWCRVWYDRPGQANHSWGYFDDGANRCSSRIRYRQ